MFTGNVVVTFVGVDGLLRMVSSMTTMDDAIRDDKLQYWNGRRLTQEGDC